MKRARPVKEVGDLTAAHLGRRIRIPGLIVPGQDWGAPRVDLLGVLQELREATPGHTVRVIVRSSIGTYFDLMPLTHPCEVIP